MGLSFTRDLELDEWSKIGLEIALIESASAWWLGDWLIYGERRFPNRYVDCVKESGLDYKTLRNYAWVARQVESTRRLVELSFAHHAEVASLPAKDQDVWLRAAVEGRWTRSTLRGRLRRARSTKDTTPTRVSFTLTASINQRKSWSEAAEHESMSLEEWARRALDHFAASSAVTDERDHPRSLLSAPPKDMAS